MSITQFVRQYSDLSTDSGFQFEFFCDRCSTGYQTDFVATNVSLLSDVMDAAGGLFGGIVGSIADVGERARSTAWEKAHDEAFQKAVQELKSHFKRCKACASWVDEACWESLKQLCQDCAEEVESEAAACAEAEVACPKCEAQGAANAKFCSACGTALKKTCSACGTQSTGKFCSECGEKL